MTRINTNVSSLVAQTNLARSNVKLQESLTRLSTGLRINTGKDDPAGLIASQALRSDIISTERAVANSERANQVIATADSSLGQVSDLLNDIRGLITEAANTGALSDDQIAANQLQIDSSLEAINRIAQTTTFQGRRLLDGSLDFLTTAGTNFTSTVSSLEIQQANLGSAGSVSVDVAISAAATKAELTATVPTSTSAVKSTFDIDLGAGLTFDFRAATAGTAFDDIDVVLTRSTSVTQGDVIATFDGENTINVTIADASGTTDTAVQDIHDAIVALAQFEADSGTFAGNFDFTSGAANGATLGTSTGGVDASTGLLNDVTIELSGTKGSEVISFAAGTTGTTIRDAINLVKDATGVEASFSGTTLTLNSASYGSKQFVDASILSETGGTDFGDSLSAARDTGSDVVATVNGVAASGSGNTLSLNTSTLDLSLTVNDGASTDFSFDITGGGALFQLGPDVVTNQQARLGILSLNTARLGGTSGKLFNLASGGTAALDTNTTLAAEIVDEVINKVTALRGRLGAFQKTTLDTNIEALNNTLVNLTEADSVIRDADFAAESAALTRAQILVQSGTAVLGIANSNPQNVLGLLR